MSCFADHFFSPGRGRWTSGPALRRFRALRCSLLGRVKIRNLSLPVVSFLEWKHPRKSHLVYCCKVDDSSSPVREMCSGPASRDRICSVVEGVAVGWFFTLTGVAVLCSVGQARHHRPGMPSACRYIYILASAKSDLVYDVYNSLVGLYLITLHSCGWCDPSHENFSCASFAQIGGPSCTSLCSITRSSSDVEGFVQSHSRTSLTTFLLLKEVESFDHFSCADSIICMSWIEIPWIFVQFLR